MAVVYSLELENALDAVREARRINRILDATVMVNDVGFEVLHALAHAPGLRLSPLMIRQRVPGAAPPLISQVVTRFVHRGFATRTRVTSTGPGVATLIGLTRDGMAAYQLACKALEVQSR
jgi:hypothetical protein